MSDLPPEQGEATDPHSGKTVRIDRQDIDVILEGLKEMPHAMTQMAAAVEQLANNTNRAPTRSYTAMLVIGVAVINLLAVGVALSIIRSDQVTNAAKASETNRLVKRVDDCLDIEGKGVDGDPVGDCAVRLLSGVAEAVEGIKLDLRCESQTTLREFIQSNPSFGIEVPPISDECKDLQPSN